MPSLTPEQIKQYNETGIYDSVENKTDRWKLRKINKNDYGRIAFLGLILIGLRGTLPINPYLDILVSILIFISTISFVYWLKGMFKK